MMMGRWFSAVTATFILCALAVGIRIAAVEKPVRVHSANLAGSTPKAVGKQPSAAPYESVLLRDVPHVRQKPDFCGEACAASWLKRLGHAVDQDDVFDQSGLDPVLARGCYTKELAAALRKIGLRIGPVWHKVTAANQQEELEAQWRALHEDLVAGIPSIVCMRYGARPGSPEHFRLVLGYDAATDEVIYHEPAEANGAYRRLQRSTLLDLWPLKYDPQQWLVIRLRLAPGRISLSKTTDTLTAADYAQHLMKLKTKGPHGGFTIHIQHPFVVIGDESPDVVKRRARETVKWAVDRLKAAYFTKDPTEILDIWLFKDKPSYEKYTKLIFDHNPNTPFGYFSHVDGALVMNIATGGGTLVHEIVHPFVASNFPTCPAWFNEGLGSLYEQSRSENGQIMGSTNWRLAGLQQAIQRRQVPSFKTLCSTTDHQFYTADKGTNYAQARYLCYYLQEHGLLRKFYHQFHANREKDPTGYATLVKILGGPDMNRFQRQWETYVMKLRFP